MMKLHYKDGDKRVTIPTDVQVLRMELANRAVLLPGSPVLVLRRADDRWGSERV